MVVGLAVGVLVGGVPVTVGVKVLGVIVPVGVALGVRVGGVPVTVGVGLRVRSTVGVGSGVIVLAGVGVDAQRPRRSARAMLSAVSRSGWQAKGVAAGETWASSWRTSS